MTRSTRIRLIFTGISAFAYAVLAMQAHAQTGDYTSKVARSICGQAALIQTTLLRAG
jgi:hypothetical protein